MKSLHDTALMIKVKQGDLDAFTEVVRRYQGNVRACLAVRLPDSHEAEDLAQEAFIIAYKKRNEFDVEKAFGPWIRTIALNLLRNYFRKYKATAIGGAIELDILVNKQIGIDYSIDNEVDRLEALKSCLAKLDEPMKKLLALRYYERQSIQELKKAMRVNHSTVTMRLHRLRENLHECIKQQTRSLEV